MTRTDPVLHRAHSSLWYAWGRIDQQKVEQPDLLGDLVGIDPFDFRDRCAAEAREYYDPEHPRSYLPSIQDQWRAYITEKG